MASKNRVLWDFFANTKPLEKGLQNVQGGFKRTESATDKAQAAFGRITRVAGAVGIALGGRELLKFAGDAIDAAVAADEMESKFRAVFRGSEDAAASVARFGDMSGVADAQAKDLFATTGNLALAMGFSDDAAVALTDEIAILAGDIASFNDADPAQVFEDLNQAALTTEREGMKKYGISLGENEIKQRALELAQKDGRVEFDKTDKALASLELASEQAGLAVGDLGKTQDSLANRQRRFQAKLENTKVAIGKELVGAMSAAMDASDLLGDNIATMAVGVAASAGIVISAFGGIVDAIATAEEDGNGWVIEALKWGYRLNPVTMSLELIGRKFLEVGTDAQESQQVTQDALDGIAADSIRTLRVLADQAPMFGAVWGEVDEAIAGTMTKIQELEQAFADFNAETAKTNDPFGIWDFEKWGEIWGAIDEGTAAAATFNEVVAGFKTPNPVSAAQAQDDAFYLNTIVP